MSEYSLHTVLRVSAAIVLLLSSVIVSMNPTKINNAISSTVEVDNTHEDSNVGLMHHERWPVLRVEFPNKPFPNSMLEDFFSGNLSANEYINQMSGGKSTLDATIIDGVWESPYSESHWGTDSSEERDVGSGDGGAMGLAENAITSLMEGIDPSVWDLDGDFIVDRVLILHSGQAQELGGTTSAIWSHYSSFNEPVTIGEYKFEHYTMASVHGGLGVLIHEMLHQMGAVDLYDVHSDAPTKSWHGLGDWDIMASGNWIDDGGRPSLPSASTLNLIGANDPTVPSAFIDRNYTLNPISEGGSPLKIEIAPGEHIWVSLRSKIGFDAGLPGEGILVEQQDLAYGDIGTNLVNTDPMKPWVKIVEADEDDKLLRGRDYGSSGDVFTAGERFGQTGHAIWDNRGRLVPWTISVTSVESNHATIEYDFVGDEKTIISMPRNPLVLLPNESVFAEVISDQECQITSELTESNGMAVPVFDRNSSLVPIIELTDSTPSKGTISGFIGCQGRPLTTLDWIVVNHQLATDSLDASVPWDEPSTVILIPETEGSGARNYRISIVGPAARVADTTTSGVYFPGDPIVIAVNPDGLLEPRMIARGELVFIDSNNIEQRIPIVLNSEGELPFGPLNWLTVPSNALTTVLILMAFSIASGHKKNAIVE